MKLSTISIPSACAKAALFSSVKERVNKRAKEINNLVGKMAWTTRAVSEIAWDKVADYDDPLLVLFARYLVEGESAFEVNDWFGKEYEKCVK